MATIEYNDACDGTVELLTYYYDLSIVMYVHSRRREDLRLNGRNLAPSIFSPPYVL